jgi:peptide/nickel transport system substrate-binding protein
VAAEEATGDHTVVFTMSQPWTGFPYALSTQGGVIASPAYLAKADAGDKTSFPIGAGPFKVSSYRPNEELTLVPNTDFSGGAPSLDQLKIVLIPGSMATYQAFQTGQLQAAYSLDPQVTTDASAKKVPNINFLANIGSELMLNDRPGLPFHDVRLRKAVAMAIDINLYNQRVNQGTARPTTELFPEGSQWHDIGVKPLPYDPAAAKQLVDQVKGSTGWDGTIRYVGSNVPEAAPIPVALQAMLQPIGIKLQVTNNLTVAQSITKVNVQHDFDIASSGSSVSDFDPFLVLYVRLYSTSPNNFGGYTSPEMDAALDELRVAATHDAQRTALRQIALIWNDTQPKINLGSVDNMVMYQKNVHGIVGNIDGVVLFDKAWLS